MERGQRNVTVDECVGLHFALELDHFGALLDPLGIEGEMRPYGPHDKTDVPGLDYGGPKPLRAEYVSRWRHGRTTARCVWTGDRIELYSAEKAE